MPRKIEYGGRTWRTRLSQLAESYIKVRVCPDCGSPRADGYVCIFCNSIN
jgi:hypothetical protein